MSYDFDWVCKEGCTECCGLVPISSLTVRLNEDKMQVKPTKTHMIKGDYNGKGDTIFFETEDWRCVFLNRTTNLCVIYSQRPLVCRQFGRVPKLLCAYIDMTGKPRTPNEVFRVSKHNEKVTAERIAKANAERLRRQSAAKKASAEVITDEKSATETSETPRRSE
jgi:Fe-S-cluster containining protein